MANPSAPTNIPIPYFYPVPYFYADSARVKFFLTLFFFHANARSDSSWTKAEEKAAKGPANGRQLHESSREEWEAIYPGEGHRLHMYIHQNNDTYVCSRRDFC